MADRLHDAFLAHFPTKDLHDGMGQAVAERTVLRKIFAPPYAGCTLVSTTDPNVERVLHDFNGMVEVVDDDTIVDWPWRFETWGEVAHRVALGNASLVPFPDGEGLDKPSPKRAATLQAEYIELRRHISKAAVLMSGRHLQHGDEQQRERNMEVFCNCATAPASFIKFMLLLNGAGVGRCYDDDMMLVNWDDAPTVRCVLDPSHTDFNDNAHESARDAQHKYGYGRDVLWFRVPDSREGWAKSLEMWEVGAFERIHKDKLLILDFSDVRCEGSAIKGMQGRPSSGPVPLMNAFARVMTIRGAGLPRWFQALYVDHYFAECVLVGGARRAARIATKKWTDPDILDFIRVKRPVEYDGLSMDMVIAMRELATASGIQPPFGFLWSSNNSVVVDEDFWHYVDSDPDDWMECGKRSIAQRAHDVFNAVMECAYGDGTGEPGFINGDKLVQNDEGWDDLYMGDYAGYDRYQPEQNTNLYLSKLAKRAKAKPLHMITNPCGEIALNILGGYCVVADVVPLHAEPQMIKNDVTMYQEGDFHTEWDDEAERAFRAVTRAMIRVNTMDSLYRKEVARTNRIGVSITGIHEYAWKRFGFGFRDLIDEERSIEFWRMLGRFSRAVYNEAVSYSALLGVVTPHTMTTMKPAGTTSKMFGLTEGGHLPAHREYMRWVQFTNQDPLVEVYGAQGYQTRKLEQYKGHTIVGFPTQPLICTYDMGDKLVLAGEAGVNEQYQWIRLLEKWWLEGGRNESDGDVNNYGNEISYTLKYRPEDVSYDDFVEMVRHNQPSVRCCTVMPQVDAVAYEYQPEEPLTREQYDDLLDRIVECLGEDVGKEHVDCGGGACPVEFGVKGEAANEVGYAL